VEDEDDVVALRCDRTVEVVRERRMGEPLAAVEREWRELRESEWTIERR
jgi:hypothetical protein